MVNTSAEIFSEKKKKSIYTAMQAAQLTSNIKNVAFSAGNRSKLLNLLLTNHL